MIEISTQLLDKCPICNQSFGLFFLPYGEEAIEKTKGFKINQILKSLFYGVQKPRSVLQLNRFFGKCRRLAENIDDNSWNTADKVKEQMKVGLEFFDTSKQIVKPNGEIHTPYRSISFANLRHMDACRFFERADDLFEKWCSQRNINPKELERESAETLQAYAEGE